MHFPVCSAWWTVDCWIDLGFFIDFAACQRFTYSNQGCRIKYKDSIRIQHVQKIFVSDPRFWGSECRILQNNLKLSLISFFYNLKLLKRTSVISKRRKENVEKSIFVKVFELNFFIIRKQLNTWIRIHRPEQIRIRIRNPASDSLILSVLRIRDVYPGALINFFLFRITDPNFFHHGSASKNLSILAQKIDSKHSAIWSGLFIPDPDNDFNPFRIPDPGVKKAPDPGSGSATLFFTHPGYQIPDSGSRIQGS